MNMYDELSWSCTFNGTNYFIRAEWKTLSIIYTFGMTTHELGDQIYGLCPIVRSIECAIHKLVGNFVRDLLDSGIGVRYAVEYCEEGLKHNDPNMQGLMKIVDNEVRLRSRML